MSDSINLSEELKKHGLRKTTFRLELLALFKEITSSLSAEEVKNRILGKTDKVTVYRALDAFEKSGLIHLVPGKGNVTRYALCQTECGSDNHLHNHVGSIFSGVYYIDAVPEQGNIQFERNDGAEYHIPSKIHKPTYYTSTRATYAAKTNALYIFPGWMRHSVEGNKTTTDRVSISFNIGEKIEN